ncbi:hypothetical protein I551_6607 [Mycobacterium ulcerans str. Harvey]|uniref:Uncharacterized protein n=1 Tax=Mycobacterium ulcerans str. Harvey TaxID=1299332 RepID=A0ABN0QR85_MYCUL|nr:hypothetical protein I551_6607 [Mycobacterium ulcerans str. Harvey]
MKPREMILRSRVWCGASMFSMTKRWTSMSSRAMSFLNLGITPFS